MIVAYYGPRHTLCSASIYNLHTLHFSWYHTCLSHSASFLTLHIFFILFFCLTEVMHLIHVIFFSYVRHSLIRCLTDTAKYVLALYHTPAKYELFSTRQSLPCAALSPSFLFLSCIGVSAKMSKFVSVLQQRGRFASRLGERVLASSPIIPHYFARGSFLRERKESLLTPLVSDLKWYGVNVR